MKNSRLSVRLLLGVLALQSFFIFSAFTSGEKEEDVVQTYKIERTYFNGTYFYVLVSGGEAKGFIKE